jgi:nitrite reductase/ring-hydroxylating ferredoxin subunit
VARYVVATVGEIPPGGRKVVEVAGRSIGIFRVGDEFFALRDRCPHQGGPLCKGPQSGFLRADLPGEYVYLRKGEIVRCPWHGWEFDLRTGQSWWDPARTRVRAYDVAVEPGEKIAASTVDDELAGAGLEPGPYVAETYPVSVDEQYVVVDVG